MYVTDPIADMLTRIRNANMVFHPSVDIPLSKIKVNIAKILKDEGFIKNFKIISDNNKKPTLRVFLKYANKERVIKGIKRISKPGRRVYVPKEKLPKVLGGLGVAVISTSQGVITDSEARSKSLGGEILCYIW